MRYLRSLTFFAVMSFVGVSSADAVPILYSMAVTITADNSVLPGTNPFFGQTYTGTFVAETTTGQVTNFQSNLLGGTFNAANLGNVATFDAANNVTRLTFQSSVTAFDGPHGFGFTSGFSNGQLTTVLQPALNPNNYFAFLDPASIVEGGGTPSFSIVPPKIPEPGSFAFLSLGLAGFAAARRRRALTTPARGSAA